ncbi:choice-of-anchor D domain-containing protein [Pseudolysobacter antarcticus]|nr:choice-of-anchor D domain-containing protein [Pseudolysobacter antarcticus]
MKAPLSSTSPAVSIQTARLSLLPASAAATTHAGPGSPICVATLQPVSRLLTGMLLLCCAASASAELDKSPSQLDFREHALGTTSNPMATTLTNTGNQSVTVIAASPATGVYARAGGSCGTVPFTVAALASCTIEHTFTPNALNVFYQTITLTLTGGDQVAFGLRGEGAQGQLVVEPFGGLAWFSTSIGTIGQEKSAYLTNVGPVPIQITEIRTSSVPAISAFVRTGAGCPPPPFQLVGQCSMTYAFVPAQVGNSTMTLDFQVGGQGSRSLDLSGDGSPEIPLFKDGFDVSLPALIE